MIKLNFCYEVSKDVGLAVTATGEKASAYTKASIEVEEPICEESYKHVHEVLIKKLIAGQLDINEEQLIPITYEEYLRDADGDEV